MEDDEKVPTPSFATFICVVAELVANEFFDQGDLEKQLKFEPIQDMMNRDKRDKLPLMQVGFIDSICLPIYEAFAMISNKLTPLLNGVKENRAQWLKLAEEKQAYSSMN
ncbi:dual 3',5'-cyclic-AMP and -GMP phosphodiesterase 11 [Caerostris darwini]|uniref:Dual 3',5'-cyclic-AMP and -GMP phosphodiesterase 11 n=1 Tax=Caerostris darwini TaxID=1538125 RepID=A0AAV4S8A7_9ARAC|nr:dual 3',5'-cyclic-AMP and -GMP phosphodiesterase 11 [Caerostris darwini]